MSETIEQKCVSKGVKLTDQRRIIAKVMSESTDHPDVDELYKRVSNIDPKIHKVLKAPHPSPLSAYRGFFGCKHFSQANVYLERNGKSPIQWTEEN